MLKSRRSAAFPIMTVGFAAISLFFFYRQNFAGQIGGSMSVAKLLWLDYAIIAWFILPFFLWRSPLLIRPLRRIYALHLVNFSLRGVIELWMMYVTFSWAPPYGIVHDLLSIAMVTILVRSGAETFAALHDSTNQAALRFLTSIRLTLACEIVFAGLFYRAIGGETAIYFASSDPAFDFINGLTWFVVLLAYSDLARTIGAARQALFPIMPGRQAEKECHV